MDRGHRLGAGGGLPIDPAEFPTAAGSAYPAPDMARLRACRLEWVRDRLRRRNLAGCLLFDPGNFRYATDSRNIAVCVQSHIGEVGGAEGAKLEEQVPITEDGVECLTSFPFDERLLPREI